jgi:hypothetical protein
MPDHVHGLICFPSDQDLQRVISDWKRYIARNTGIRWQRDFFDHRIRNEESLAEKWNYIVQNPVRASLVTSAEEWPYVWFGRDGIGRDRSPSGPIARNVCPKCPHNRDGGFGETALPRKI